MVLKRKYVFISSLLFILTALLYSVLLNGCKGKSDGSYTLTGDTIADGKNLVQIHCTKCHALVPANALIKDVWKYHTLPSMAPYFGITPYLDGYFKKGLDTAGTNGLTLLEWQNIVSYYQKIAPATLPVAKPPVQAVNDWAGFSLKMPSPVNSETNTTMVALNPYNHKIYTADGITEGLFEWDSNLKIDKTVKLPSPAVAASFVKDSAGTSKGLFSCIGQLQPVDFPNGKVISIDFDSKNTDQSIIASELARPVQAVSGDFNKDGLTDWVICGQGKLKGGVYLFKQNKDHSYTQSNISDQPGAVQAVAGDFDHDGWVDLMVLYGSVDEGLWLYTNDHKGGFTAKNLLRFPPVYGSTSFQLVDMDHDGNLDLIYTCGYNFHDSRIFKPYHGLYIFKNMGNWNFKQQWFYPINGLTKAIAADFDGDGDFDIITSAFFADFKDNPGEGCVYFEQDKPFSFKAHAIPVSKYGRWFSMDVGDYNNDGKPDVLLGNYATGYNFIPGFQPFWTKNIPFIILENQFKK
jgi:hypothetical protein